MLGKITLQYIYRKGIYPSEVFPGPRWVFLGNLKQAQPALLRWVGLLYIKGIDKIY